MFTTELSNLPAPNTTVAKKQPTFFEELESRKRELFQSSYIQQFPITVIFAMDNKYIETAPGEVRELFNVKYDSKTECSGRNLIYIHTNKTEDPTPRLVIHTRQLTNSIPKDLISKIADIIVAFVEKNSIEIDVYNR